MAAVGIRFATETYTPRVAVVNGIDRHYFALETLTDDQSLVLFLRVLGGDLTS